MVLLNQKYLVRVVTIKSKSSAEADVIINAPLFRLNVPSHLIVLGKFFVNAKKIEIIIFTTNNKKRDQNQ